MEYEVKLAFDPELGTWAARALNTRRQLVAIGTGLGMVHACESLSQELERLWNAQAAQAGGRGK